MPIHLFFSNTIETLAASFTRNLSEKHDLFNPSTIIVPNPYMQKWLQLQIANACGISLHNKFSFLNTGLWNTLAAMLRHTVSPVHLEQNEMRLLVYASLRSMKKNDPRVRPLAQYLDPKEQPENPDYEKKAWQLSDLLARYFLEYETSREEMIQYWLAGRLVYNTEMECSQQYLYHSIFDMGGLRDMMDENKLTLSQFWSRSRGNLNPDPARTLFLFGKSQLSSFHTRMLYELGHYVTIYLYQVNPCSEFWEDVTTPAEDRWKKIRSINVEDTAGGLALSSNDNENYLLKLWGKTGRETIKLLSLLEEAGSRDMNTASEWLSDEFKAAPDSCLHLVQDQILRRISPAGSSCKMPRDRSIQVGACPDIFREAETVYYSIIQNLKYNPGLMMSDIAIMVPDMSLYGPVINSVFSRNPKQISYSMIDSTAAIDSLLGKAVSTLLEIAGGSFTRKTVFDLIFNQCFLDAHDMDTDDARICLSWTDSLNIFHTFCRDESVNPEHNLYTWQQGLQRIRFGRIIQPSGMPPRDGIFLNYKNIIPYSDSNTGNLKLLDTFTGILELLYERTKFLPGYLATAEEWMHIITSLLDTFLVVPSTRPEESAVRTTLFKSMKDLVAIDRLSGILGPSTLTFPFIREYILGNIMTIPSTRGSYLSGGVNISALVPKRQIPFKVVYIMGMQEGLFPGTADTSTLNVMNIRRQIGDTSRPDANRYLFLETLLATREKLYITYVSRDLQKDQEYFPNSVLGQFLTYLNTYVTIDTFTPVSLPADGSAEQYLQYQKNTWRYSDLVHYQSDGILEPTNCSLADRLVLLNRALKKSGNDPHATVDIHNRITITVPDFSIKKDKAALSDDIMHSLTLRDLALFINNPAESTLRWHLGIYDENPDDRSGNDIEPFYSVYPYSYRFVTDILNFATVNDSLPVVESYMAAYYNHARLMSSMPTGAFGDLDYNQLRSVIMERLYGPQGISTFINQRKGNRIYRNIRFGSMTLPAESDFTTGPATYLLRRNNRQEHVTVSGLLPFLWIDPSNNHSETLVITNSDRLSITHLVMPFLFYLCASTGAVESLRTLLGGYPFTIYVSSNQGISSYTYRLSPNECIGYTTRLLADFLDETSFDFLPLKVIEAHPLLRPAHMKPFPDEQDRKRYREYLAGAIDENRNSFMPTYQSPEIFELIEASVPADAYDKARDRLEALFKPLIKMEDSPHE